MDIDIDRQINAIKKLIPFADGDHLTFLTNQLTALLKKKEELAKSKPVSNQEEDKLEQEPEVPSLSTQENVLIVKILRVDKKTLEEMFISRDTIQDFMKKCVEDLVNKVANENTKLRIIKAKCYLQVKVNMEYYHDKPHEPLFKTTKVPSTSTR
jgi:hypothetical protein